jgi:hypothetical protein
MNFAAITLCVASQRVFIVVSVYISLSTQSGNFWIHTHTCTNTRYMVVFIHYSCGDEALKAMMEDRILLR